MSKGEWTEELASEADSVLTYLCDVRDEVRDSIADLEEAIRSEDARLCEKVLATVNEV